ncbi:hypothetical protein Tco_0759849 [Tanacetum coccineum]
MESIMYTSTPKIQADYDMKATNIILQGLPADIYSLERECKLYDAFNKFTHIKGESLHKYYLRFTQLINDMNIYNMKIEQFQVNTKFLNSLPLEWSKFVTDVKLVKDLHTTNFDQLHAYLEQHELYANEVHLQCERDSQFLRLRKFLRALYIADKWRAKVMAFEESKDLSHYLLIELIWNLKIRETTSDDKKGVQRSRDARTVKVIENALDVATQIILLENVQNHRKIRTKELLSEALGAIAVKKMMKRSKMKRVSEITKDGKVIDRGIRKKDFEGPGNLKPQDLG